MKRGSTLYFIATVVVVLLLCIFAVAYASYQSRDIKLQNQIKEIREIVDDLNIHKPVDGKDGVTEVITRVVEIPAPKAANGVDGRNGSDATDEQIDKSVSTYMAKNPAPKGDKGEQGDLGISTFVRKNILTNKYECRYADDSTWNPLDYCL